MKKHLLLLALGLGLASSAWADLTGTGTSADPYQIATAQDLVDFASITNGTNGKTLNQSACAQLTADIDLQDITWTPIGDYSSNGSKPYLGTFDGQGHSIKNLEFTVSANYKGFIGVAKTNAVIKDFSIYGDITVSGGKNVGVVGYTYSNTTTISNVQSYLNFTSTVGEPMIGGIVGSVNKGDNTGSTTIDHCGYYGTITTSGSNVGVTYGGMVGKLAGGTKECIITNCIFAGEFVNNSTGSGVYFGGLIGYNTKDISYTIKNCLSVGKVTANNAISGYGMVFGKLGKACTTSNLVNVYYTGTNFCAGKASNYSGAITAADGTTTIVTADQLATGEVTYLLNGSVQGGTNFYQTIGTDAMPTLDATHSLVYANGSYYCDGTAKGDVTYSNTESSVTDPHAFVDGICSACGIANAEYLTANDEGYYEISTPAQLKWFAAYVNTISTSAKAKLTADIDMSSVTDWEPIGYYAKYSKAYNGTFDGQNHSITGLTITATEGYQGLFGSVHSTNIKNFTISGNVTVTGGKYIGVIGNTYDTSNITNVISYLNYTTDGAEQPTGGIVGWQSDGTTNISNCAYYGTLTATGGGTTYGGVIGYVSNSANFKTNISNTIFGGTINSSTTAGGFIGYTNGAVYTFTNNLSYGTVTAPTNNGMFFGVVKKSSTITNCYYVGSSVYGTESTVAPTANSVTTDQLASGEVAYNLGSAYYQTIGTDNAPVLSATSKQVYQLTIGSAGYATFVTPVAVSAFPTGVTANAGQAASTYVHLEPVAAAPANTALVLKAAEGSYYYNGTDEEVSLGTTNDLKAAAEAVTADGTQYILAKSDDVVGFYQATTGTTIAAGKAYIESTSGVKSFIFSDDENATAINSVNADASVNGAIYNLAGQRISNVQKGINIVNGKKYLY